MQNPGRCASSQIQMCVLGWSFFHSKVSFDIPILSVPSMSRKLKWVGWRDCRGLQPALSASRDREGQPPECGFERIDLQLNIVDLSLKGPGPTRLLCRQSHAINPCSLVSALFVRSSVYFLPGHAECGILWVELQCKYWWYLQKACAWRLSQDWSDKLTSSPTPFSVALLPKEQSNKTPADLQMYTQSLAFVEPGMNLTICLFPPGRISGPLQTKFFPVEKEDFCSSALLPYLRNELYCIYFPQPFLYS